MDSFFVNHDVYHSESHCNQVNDHGRHPSNKGIYHDQHGHHNIH